MRDLFDEIFRAANLTEADFIALQHQLQEQNPEHNSRFLRGEECSRHEVWILTL